jgi:sodium/hydrogen exchanger 8
MGSELSATKQEVNLLAEPMGQVDIKPIVEEITHSWALFLLIVSILLCVLLIYALLYLNFHYLPGSVVVIVIGMILGAFVKASGKDLHNIVKFNADNFFLFLLPPIIFESGYTVNKENFIDNLGTINVFAVGGTIISAVIVGFGLYLIGLIPHLYNLTLIEW